MRKVKPGIGRIVRERPELIVITDDVYAPFVEGFRSLAAVAARRPGPVSEIATSAAERP